MGAIGVMLLLAAAQAAPESVRALEKSRDALLEAVAGLTAEQLNWKARPEADSLLEMARYVAENEASPGKPLPTLSAVLDHFEAARAKTIERARRGEDVTPYVKFTMRWTERILVVRSLPQFPKGPSKK